MIVDEGNILWVTLILLGVNVETARLFLHAVQKDAQDALIYSLAREKREWNVNAMQ